jgi:sugar O-acyltransferase (sialic acid O-acetyltransferase NeuD family)
MKDAIIVVGGGEHATVIIDVLRCASAYDIVAVIDPKLTKNGLFLGIPVAGDDSELSRFYAEGIRNVCVGVGRIGRSNSRKTKFEMVKELGFNVPFLAHPSAIIARDVVLKEGCQVMAGAIIQPGSSIAENAIVNTGAVLDHDCAVGPHAHVCPGVTVSGGCFIGENSFIGAGAVIIHGITIGRDVVVGAGAVVIADVADGATVKGVPAR